MARTRGAASGKKPAPRARAAEMTPLDYLLQVMRDEGATPAARMNAAKVAAPYVHARLASTELKSGELDRIGDSLAGLLKRAQENGGGVASLIKR